MPFKSAHWTFLNSEDTYESKSVNGMHWKNVSVAMVTVNIAQNSDALMIVANVGRTLKMRKQEIIYITTDYKDADYFLMKLCEPGIISDSYIHVDKKNKILETSNFQVQAVTLSGSHNFITRSAVDFYLISDKPLIVRLAELTRRYEELETIKMRLSLCAKEIDFKKLIDILNGV
jgi:hypothetical protein